jgi:hypothetical protein
MSELKKMVAFCPWVQFSTQPFTVAGVHVMGFCEAAERLTVEDQQVLWRAATPYYDHVLDAQGGLRSWNDNPLIYVLDPENPLKHPSPDEIRHISLANTYLYICTFALNTPAPGGLQCYTSGADWALYFQPVDDPEFFALSGRRLYGATLGGGYQWTKTAFTLPVECNRFELMTSTIDGSLVEGVTALYNAGRAPGYLFPLRTFVSGTSDTHLWERERDLSSIWGAVEQVFESDHFRACTAAQREIALAADALTVEKKNSMCFVRAVLGSLPPAAYVWPGSFRPNQYGKPGAINQARGKGVLFSALERALDELNWARNRIVHDGFISDPLDWATESLAYLGSRFWIVAFKRILAWEGVRKWTDKDECEVIGLQALAKDGQKSLIQGYQAYERAVKECHDRQVRERFLEEMRKKGIS